MSAAKLYHRDIGFPVGLLGRFFPVSFPLQYSHHARQAALNDRYGPLPKPVPKEFRFLSEQIVEVEMTGGVLLTKFVARIPYTPMFDLVLVVIPGGTVKTLWLNEVNDKHATLQRHLYSNPT